MVPEQNLIGWVVRWTARALSTFSTFVLLLFIFGEPFSVTRIKAVEWIGLLFFPVGVVAGFVVAWWKEGLGGALTVISVLAFYLVFGLFFLPAIAIWAGDSSFLLYPGSCF